MRFGAIELHPKTDTGHPTDSSLWTKGRPAAQIVKNLEAAGRSWKFYRQVLPLCTPLKGADLLTGGKQTDVAFASSINMAPLRQLDRDIATNSLPDYAFVVSDAQLHNQVLSDGSELCSEESWASVGDAILRSAIEILLNNPTQTSSTTVIVIFTTDLVETENIAGYGTRNNSAKFYLLPLQQRYSPFLYDLTALSSIDLETEVEGRISSTRAGLNSVHSKSPNLVEVNKGINAALTYTSNEFAGNHGIDSVSVSQDKNQNTQSPMPMIGVANVSDYGAVADGGIVANVCAGHNCYVGQSNVAAIEAAIAALPNGGTVYFPNSGTNIWMLGSTTECGAGSGSLIKIPDKITFQGQGQWTTVIMQNPSSNCDMFVPASEKGSKFVTFKDIRLDGNESTDSIHNDVLHPDNGLSTNAYGRAFYWNTGTDVSEGGPSLTFRNIAITGFPGDPTYKTAVLIFGNNWVDWDNVRIVYNQWAHGLWHKTSDSVFRNLYMASNGGWNSKENLIVEGGAGNNFDRCYLGGGDGGGAQAVIKGSSFNSFSNCINDHAHAAAYRFIDGSDKVCSESNSILGGAITAPGIGTLGSDFVSIEGCTSRTLISNVQFGSDSRASVHGITELGDAAKTVVVGNVFKLISGGVDNLLPNSGSIFLGNIGINDNPADSSLASSSPSLNDCDGDGMPYDARALSGMCLLGIRNTPAPFKTMPCDISRRGNLWYEAGGAGISDVVFVCSKDASDSYVWRVLD